MRRILIAGFVALPVLALLVFLGTWQLGRLHWKTALLADLAAAEAAPAAPLRDPPLPFTKVAVTGRFDHAREALLGLEVRSAVLGARLVTPLLRDGAAPVLVDRGWVPAESRGPIARPEGVVTVEGYVRPGDRAGLFAARDDPASRRFFTLDPAAIGAALGLPAVAPYAVVALGGPAGTPPDPARSLPRPPNNHLGYVITWYGLALALVAVFLAWALRTGRRG
jgi:surfeit locus 1 family protein